MYAKQNKSNIIIVDFLILYFPIKGMFCFEVILFGSNFVWNPSSRSQENNKKMFWLQNKKFFVKNT